MGENRNGSASVQCVIPACFKRESRGPVSVTRQWSSWMPDTHAVKLAVRTESIRA
jgi:hypothetical protein